MARRLEWTKPANKHIRRLDRKMANRIMLEVTDWASTNPNMHKQLEDTDGLYSYRVGVYRVLYELEFDAIIVIGVISRNDSYQSRYIRREE